jgi:hypothetical protein
LVKEAAMTTYAVNADGLLVEESLAWRRAGDEIAAFVTSGRAKTLVEAVRIARDERPEAAHIYEGDVGRSFLPPLAPGGEVQGPRAGGELVPDPLFLAVRAKYAARYPEAAQATNGRELVDLLVRGRQREAPTLSYPEAYAELMRDRELRAVYR